jgi:hypothetical protein
VEEENGSGAGGGSVLLADSFIIPDSLLVAFARLNAIPADSRRLDAMPPVFTQRITKTPQDKPLHLVPSPYLDDLGLSAFPCDPRRLARNVPQITVKGRTERDDE